MTNNATTAQLPPRLVAENMGVILQQVFGLVEREGQGTFKKTTLGEALDALLVGIEDEAARLEIVKDFLDIKD